jgi:hypothetical protein
VRSGSVNLNEINILVIAALKAALSSVLPSPFAPKSFTFRYTTYSELSVRKGLVPWCGTSASQKDLDLGLSLVWQLDISALSKGASPNGGPKASHGTRDLLSEPKWPLPWRDG